MTKRMSAQAIERMALAVALGLSLSACGSDDDDNAQTPATTHIEIAGQWENQAFGETDAIDDTSWAQTFDSDPDPPTTITSAVTKFDNKQNFAIVMDEYGKFGKNVWTSVDGDAFYYCMAAFGKDSAEEAETDAQPADDADPETSGCGDASFPWTKLTKQ